MYNALVMLMLVELVRFYVLTPHRLSERPCDLHAAPHVIVSALHMYVHLLTNVLHQLVCYTAETQLQLET